MTGQEIVLLLSVSVGSLILGACTARKELLEGVCCHWRAVLLCIVCKSFLLPFTAWCLSVLWSLDHDVSVGMIILASVPSSPISNLWQWLSCAHIGLGAFLTFASNLSSLASVQLILRLYLGNIVNENYALDSMSILIYTCAYSLPIVFASTMCYFFVPADKEVHWKWKALAICALVTFSGLAFLFVGNSPLGMTIDPLRLFTERKPKDYCAVLSFLAANYLIGFGVGNFFKLPKTICRTLSIEVAMQNDWLALHIVRGTHAPLLYIFPVILYSSLQGMLGPVVMAIFKHMYQSEQVSQYIKENKLHDSFRGPGHFESDDSEQVSLQTRHNKAVSRIFGKDIKARYAKPIWFLPTKVKQSLTQSKKASEGGEDTDTKDRLIEESEDHSDK
jgi:BASS family bile acid:Na+ symporter